MAIDFPGSPSVNDTFTSGSLVYTFDGTKWTAEPAGVTGGTKIEVSNTKAEIIDTGTDGRFVVTTEGSERLRVTSAGEIGLAGANYGTSGQVLTSGGTGAAPTWKAGGKILQVIESTVAGKASTTSTSLTKLATSSSITPSSTSSKILVTVCAPAGNADTGNANFSLVRTISGSDTTIFSTFLNKQGDSGSYQADWFSWSELDSPSTTSAITYSVSGVRLDGDATPFIGGRNTDSAYAPGVVFILQEVAS